MTSSYDESRFRRQVDAALVKVKTILDNTREPTYPADVSHKYDDKYMLVDFITNTSLASQLTCLELLGLTGEGFQQLKQWSANRTITLRLKAESTCTFDREVTKDVESATKHVTEYKSGYTGSKWSATDKVVTKVTEYFWKYAATWVLFAYQGNDPETKIVFQQRSSSHELVTSTNSQPYSKVTVEPSIDLNISWLFTNLSDTFSLNFGINRQTKSCRTPRRNSDVETALSYFRSFHQWASSVQSYFNGKLFPVQTNHGLDMGKINDSDTFIPVVPLFEESADKKKAKESSEKTLASVAESKSECVLRTGDVNSFLVEQKRSLLEKHKEIETMFPDGGAKGKAKLISNQEAKLVVVVMHAQRVCQHFTDGVQYVEEMLRQQLISAIGKEVQATDFVNYMLYHNRVIFKGEYEPRPFCYAVRRPDHYPEGIVTIEATVGNANPEPIQTTVSHSRAVVPMNFPISAAVKVQFLGDRFLHGWVSQQFSGYSGVELSLTARARQFSCFIMLIGTIASATTFEPKHAIIIQNKDDLKIPLVLEQIPTPQAFSDAIESLSPEQQRFAKAYRQMQLANTLFGICLIQIKPQLEKLLNLPDDSLTKEIRLTQDLLELFLKYQIPSDLVSYEGSPKADVHKKVDAVRGHVAAMQEMIKLSKQNEIDEQKMVTAYAKALVHEDTSFSSGAAVIRNTFQNAAVERSSAPTTGGAKAEEPQVVEKVDPNVIDYTKIPKRLDKSFQKFDEDNALHSTIIKTSGNWTKKSQKALLAEPTTNIVGADGQLDEKNKAYDLLDALSRSGVLGIDAAELHVVLAATHCFDSTLINTLVQQNVNPIEKVERSTMIMAMEIHSKPASELLIEHHVERVLTYSPMLFDNKEKAAVKSLTA